MELLLIRHGETVDNVAQVYAGVTDSALTAHGSIQARKLGHYLAARHKLTHVFSSDLRRARKTAEAICSSQRRKHDDASEKLDLVELGLLQERDFGSFEKKPYSSRPKAGRTLPGDDPGPQLDGEFKDVESSASMTARMDEFLEAYLVPLLQDSDPNTALSIAVVSHGMVLSALWKCLLSRFALNGVHMSPAVAQRGDVPNNELDKLGGWSNTGYLELQISKEATSSKSAGITEILASEQEIDTNSKKSGKGTTILYGWTLTVKAVNSKEHLRGLKRTRGGIGSSRYSESQTSLDAFVKKRRLD